MKALRFLVPILAVLLSGLVRPLLAQSTPAPRSPEASREENYVTEKGFASRVFEVRHRDPGDLASVLRPLGSGYRGAAVSANRDFKTITVRDFPENIATIEAALKRLDVPEAAKKDVELRLWVLVASNGEGGPVVRFPKSSGKPSERSSPRWRSRATPWRGVSFSVFGTARAASRGRA